jgi:hypothetical protein
VEGAWRVGRPRGNDGSSEAFSGAAAPEGMAGDVYGLKKSLCTLKSVICTLRTQRASKITIAPVTFQNKTDCFRLMTKYERADP